ncbi:hypothetical protein V6Z11_A13G194900 [Gossypium hirsutum]
MHLINNVFASFSTGLGSRPSRASPSTTISLNPTSRLTFTACKRTNASTANGVGTLLFTIALHLRSSYSNPCDIISPLPYCPDATKYNFPLSTGHSGEYFA